MRVSKTQMRQNLEVVVILEAFMLSLMGRLIVESDSANIIHWVSNPEDGP